MREKPCFLGVSSKKKARPVNHRARRLRFARTKLHRSGAISNDLINGSRVLIAARRDQYLNATRAHMRARSDRDRAPRRAPLVSSGARAGACAPRSRAGA
jgi:hypothetical protein